MDSLKCFLQLKKSFLFSMKILSSQRWSALCGNPQKPTETLKHWASWSRDSSLSATTVCQNHPTLSPGPSLVQNGGSEIKHPWPRLLKYSKNCGVFCHVTHDEMAFLEVISSIWQPCSFSCNLKPLFNKMKTFHCVLPDKILTNFWSHLAALAGVFSDHHFE